MSCPHRGVVQRAGQTGTSDECPSSVRNDRGNFDDPDHEDVGPLAAPRNMCSLLSHSSLMLMRVEQAFRQEMDRDSEIPARG